MRRLHLTGCTLGSQDRGTGRARGAVMFEAVLGAIQKVLDATHEVLGATHRGPLVVQSLSCMHAPQGSRRTEKCMQQFAQICRVVVGEWKDGST